MMSPSNANDLGQVLGFTPEWYALGIVDDAQLARLRADWDKGEDDNTEHYRYRAFGDFVLARRPLSPDLALALYELGSRDADVTMGGAIMAHIVYLPECPEAVLEVAASSGRRHLVRAVGRRRLIAAVQEARQDFAEGRCVPATPDEIMREILE